MHVRIDQPRQHPELTKIYHLAATVLQQRISRPIRFDPRTRDPNRHIGPGRPTRAIQHISRQQHRAVRRISQQACPTPFGDAYNTRLSRLNALTPYCYPFAAGESRPVLPQAQRNERHRGADRLSFHDPGR